MAAPVGILFNGATLLGAGPHLILADVPSAGESLAILSAVDPDSGDSFSFELLDDAGGLFFLTDNLIRRSAGGVLDPDATAYTLRLRVTDSTGLSFEADAVVNVAALDTIIRRDGTAGDDTLVSAPGQEFFLSTAGNDTIDAGNSDFIVYSGRREDYALVYTPGSDGYGGYGSGDPEPDTVSVTDLRSGGPDGADLIINPSLLRFSDGDVLSSALDIARPALTITGQDLEFDAYVPENEPAGYVIGTLSALGLDPDLALNILSFEVLSFRNVPGFPQTVITTTFFTIDAQQRLVTAAPLDFEEYNLHFARIEFTDDQGALWRDSIRIDILNSADAPTGVLIRRDLPGGGTEPATVAEHANRLSDIEVGRLDFFDQDGAPAGYAITVAPDFASDFYVVGDRLFLRQGALIDFETRPRVTIDLIVQDLALRPDQAVTLTVGFDVTFAPLQGTVGPDGIVGTAGNDVIRGLAGDDQLNGGLGNDTLIGGAGANLLSGGGGNDLLIADQLSFPSTALRWTQQGGSGTNIAGGFVQTIGSVDATVEVELFGDGVAVISNDSIYVETEEPFAPNSLYLTTGGAGPTSSLTVRFSDVAGSAAVSDVVFRLLEVDGITWQDIVTITAFAPDGAAVPVVLASNGQDLINGNIVTGAFGNDDFDSATGSILVRIPGPVHKIVVFYENGRSASQALGISDIHFFTPVGVPGSLLFGEADNDTLIGGAGTDTLDGGTGADSMAGGLGNDHYSVDNPGDVVKEEAGGGIDGVRSSLAAYTLTANMENLTLTGAAAINGTGNILNNLITGNAAANSLTGDAGNDTLNGGGGNDTLVGGAGNDTLVGGAGNDSYLFDTDLALGSDTLNEAGGGSDTLNFAATTTRSIALNLGLATTQVVNANLSLTLGSAATVENVIGGSLADTLTGNSLANSLTGGAGNDTLTGGLGADRFRFATAPNATTNRDVITDFSITQGDTIELENAVFTALPTTGTLDASAFLIGTAATTGSQRILYDSATGVLAYDADGNGATAAIAFATLSTGLALTSSQFMVT